MDGIWNEPAGDAAADGAEAVRPGPPGRQGPAPARNEAAWNEPAQNEPVWNELAQNEPAQNELDWNDPAQSEPAWNEPAQDGPDAAAAVRPGPPGKPGTAPHPGTAAERRLTMLPSSSHARARKTFTVHIGPAGRITLASRDNQAAGTHRPATLRVGARGSVLRIGTAAAQREPATPPIPPE